MRVLITGHAGYLGPIMIRLFRRAGHQVVGFDTGYFRDLIEDPPAECRPDAEIRGDIRDIDEGTFRGIDAVVHLAALSNDPICDIVAAKTAEINGGGTARAGAAAKRAGVRRFIFASSCSLYGKSAGATRPLDESRQLAPVSAYAHSKAAGEAALAGMADRDFEPIMLRNADSRARCCRALRVDEGSQARSRGAARRAACPPQEDSGPETERIARPGFSLGANLKDQRPAQPALESSMRTSALAGTRTRPRAFNVGSHCCRASIVVG